MTTINDKLAELKGQAEADLAKVNAQIAGNASTLTRLQARKTDLEAMLAEFTHDYPTVVAKPVAKPGKITP